MTIDDEVICELIRHKEATIALFGEGGKQERERLIFRAFLRCLGHTFDSPEIKSIPGNHRFPDVEFRGEKFEIKEMMDPGRKRHDELKRALEKLKKRKPVSWSDFIKDYRPVFLNFDEVGQRIEQFVKDQCLKYSENQRANTNLLIYFNLQDFLLDTKKRVRSGCFGQKDLAICVSGGQQLVLRFRLVHGGATIYQRECW